MLVTITLCVFVTVFIISLIKDTPLTKNIFWATNSITLMIIMLSSEYLGKRPVETIFILIISSLAFICLISYIVGIVRYFIPIRYILEDNTIKGGKWKKYLSDDPLEASIQVWEFKRNIVKISIGKILNGIRNKLAKIHKNNIFINITTSGCPLCISTDTDCSKCVIGKTNHLTCSETPHDLIIYAIGSTITEETVKLFDDEISFLKSLRNV